MVSSRTEVPTEHAPDQRASQEGSGSDGHGNSSHSGGESLARIFFKDINFTLAERSRKRRTFLIQVISKLIQIFSSACFLWN